MTNRLSYTSVERFLECPQKFYLNDIQKIREKQIGSAFPFGKALDLAINHMLLNPNSFKYLEIFENEMLSQEINGIKEDLEYSENIRYSKSDLDLSLIDHVDIQDLYNLSWHSLIMKGRMLLQAYKQEVLPKIKRVIAVQEELLLETEEGDKFVGFVDMVVEWEDGRVILFDNKTASRAYKPSDVQASKQLATYYSQLQSKYNIDAIGFIVLDKNIRKREPRVRIQVLIDNIDTNVVESVMNDYDRVNYLVKQGSFPKNESACFGRFGKCSYYDLCHNGSMEGLVCTKKDK